MTSKKPPPKPREKKPDPDQGLRFREFALKHGATDADALDKAMGSVVEDAAGKKPKPDGA